MTEFDRRWVLASSRGVVTRRSAIGVLAGGLVSVAWGEVGVARKSQKSRNQRSVGAEAKAGAVQRPIDDFLDAQGTTSVFFPPVADLLAWATSTSTLPIFFAFVDWKGVVQTYFDDEGVDIDLGTSTSGKVTERALKDGRAQVQVVLHTRNAFSWAIKITGDEPGNPLTDNPTIFGHRAQEVKADPSLVPALGEANFDVTFTIEKPGADLVDLAKTLNIDPFLDPPVLPPPWFELIALKFHARADGDLPDGSAGRLIVAQTGVQLNRQDRPGAIADGFPAEMVRVQPVGR